MTTYQCVGLRCSIHWLFFFSNPFLALVLDASGSRRLLPSIVAIHFSTYFRMTLEQIRNRMHALQQQINQLAAELPEDARIAFGTRYVTEPSPRGARKELVITLVGDE